MPISDKITKIEASKSVELSRLVSKLKVDGENIIGLHVGEIPDPTDKEIIEATKMSLDSGHTRYSNPEGITPLRTMLSEIYSREFQMEIEADNIFIGNGSKHVLYNIFQILTNPGDEYLVPVPYWVTIPESVKLAGGQPIFVETGLKNLDIKLIEKSISQKTKGIIINSPNNPSGAVYSEKEIEGLVQLTRKYGLYLISDEAYDRFVYDGEYASPLHYTKSFEKIIIVKTFSKAFKMTGFRLGLMIANKKIIHASKTLQSHLSGNPCTFAQYGAIEALKSYQQIVPPLIKQLKEKRDFSFQLFSKCFQIEKPRGGFYLFANIQDYINRGQFKDCNDMAMAILKEAKVAVLPGIVFGQPNYLRICFTESLKNIEEAYRRIEEIL